MKLPRRNFLHLAAGAAALCLLSVCMFGAAWSQTTRTIKIVVPFAPGGAASVLARLLADEIAKAQRLTTVVENRPGAGTAIATEAVARAQADGNTLLINNPALLINPHLKQQNYDPFNSFEPICNLVDSPTFLTVNSGSPYRTLNDFVVAARAMPGQLTVASFTATAAHIALEDFKRRAKVDVTLVPYPGSAPAVTALLGGHVTAMLDNFATMAEHVNSGKMRALATFSPTRIDGLAHIPTFAESGYNEYVSWFALFAPANLSSEKASELVAWSSAAMRQPDVKRKLEPVGLFPAKLCGADFASLLRKQYDEFGRIIREVNIKAE
jgi:tripartite-type tricarboxylate transporter receptor subunit TctC